MDADEKRRSIFRRPAFRAGVAVAVVGLALVYPAVDGFYGFRHAYRMRRARATPPDERAFDWIVASSRDPVGDLVELASRHPKPALSGLGRLASIVWAGDAESQAKAVQLLGITEEQFATLRALLRHDSADVRIAALDLFTTQTWLPGAARETKRLLADPDPSVRAAALGKTRWFRFADDPEWLEAVVRLTEDAHGEVRWAARYALAGSKRAEYLPRLIAPLEQEAPEVTRHVMACLGELAAKEGLPVLRRLLADDDPEVVAAACTSLGNIGEAEDIGKLVGILRRPNRPVSNVDLHLCVGGDLSRLTGQDFLDDVTKWEAWWKANKNSFDFDELVKAKLSAPTGWAWAHNRIKTRNMVHLLPDARRAPRRVGFHLHRCCLLAWFGDKEAALWLADQLDHDEASMRLGARGELERVTLSGLPADRELWRDFIINKWKPGVAQPP